MAGKRAACGGSLCLVLALSCEPSEPPGAEAADVARAFIEAFAAGDYSRAARHAKGDVLRGVEVQRRAREEEREAHPAEVGLFEKAMREHPPTVEVHPPRTTDGGVDVRADVTTVGPRGPELARYRLRLARRGKRWLVSAWERR